ncbi:MAG: hypothetical protein ABJ215_03415 [Alphaproteobacteria bacterium]
MRKLAIATFLLVAATQPAAAVDLVTSAKEFFGNSTYRGEAFVTGFLKNVQNQSDKIDDKHFQFYSRLEMDTFTGITDELFFNFNAQAVANTGRSETRRFLTPPGNERSEARWIDVNRAFLSLEKFDYTVVVGKAPIEVGFANLYAPTDRFGFVAGANPLHAQEFGVWQGRFDYFIENDTLSFYVMPFEERAQSSDGDSRWKGLSGDGTFFSVSTPTVVGGPPVRINERFRDSSVSNWSYMTKYEGVRDGFDFYALAHVGPSVYPVLESTTAPNVFIKSQPKAFSPAAGASVTFGEWQFYSDAIYQHTYDDEDQKFIKYSVGGTVRETEFASELGLEEIRPVLEFSQDLSMSSQTATNFVTNSARSRPHRQSVLMRITFQRDDEWSFRIGGTHNFRDGDSSLGSQISFEPDDNTEFRLSGGFYNGPDDTQFGRWRKNDYIELGFIRSF